ncbi:dTDP-4-amino-4,6-dideoxygalactose transaminase [Sphaerospermopsis kisseleviana CS-549]|uniref:dTDP-4-amino-4,6-dideoxygalactose transaminase n=1 Tax=Sphaerospermopsis kisseleviana CS-549 TaxID=3021783 RepID=A0ABT4ZRZ2_9CYAN|nr:dTDP-4-amino-4,6-dideoxygalactose transaminase [Sphaerospermopsis kisseleviana]MDB9442150.1 dTDP-4-amino-4,6-dideoxygalactose transaminase [Sphaerospermopsis kisseleviana CS-549]
MNKIPFNKPYMTGKELWYISQAHHAGQLAGDGNYTKKCHQWLETHTHSHKALLTHSCTAALEMSAILADLEPGDEVIMPSYTFVSTANAFVLRGAIPVFVDIRPDTLNLDETLVETAITHRTRAIVPVHYAGVGCEMDTLQQIATKHQLLLIEDAAQGLMSSYKGKPLGSFGDLACFSFHETKNIIAGEGGALIINNPQFTESAEIIREKGTNRSQFFRGQVDKYTWIEKGSSYLPGELIAAFLYAQLEEAQQIITNRLKVWDYYHQLLEPVEKSGKLRRPIIPPDCQHNAHMYYILLEDLQTRTQLINYLKEQGINAVFHYVPLHSSPGGKHYGRVNGKMDHTNLLSDCLLRLPMFPELTTSQIEIIVGAVKSF